MLNFRRGSPARAFLVTQGRAPVVDRSGERSSRDREAGNDTARPPAIPAILRAAIDAIPGCAAVLDERARILAVNVAWRRFLAASGLRGPDRGRPASYLELWAKAGFEGPRLARVLRNVLVGEDDCRLEYRRGGPRGTRSFELRLTYLPGDGPARVLAIHEEITAGERPARARVAVGEQSRIQDDERRRIARELHDTTGQDLSAAVLDLQRALSMPASATHVVQPMIAEALGLCERSLEEIRTLSYQLHPPMLDEAGLGAALRWYVQAFSRRSGIKVELRVPPVMETLSAATATALFRVAQEALLNVQRHSGSASAAVRLVQQGGAVRLEVQDHGRGLGSRRSRAPGVTAAGRGIHNMRDRTRSCGGRLEIVSNARGTLVRAIVPGSEGPDAADPPRGRS